MWQGERLPEQRPGSSGRRVVAALPHRRYGVRFEWNFCFCCHCLGGDSLRLGLWQSENMSSWRAWWWMLNVLCSHAGSIVPSPSWGSFGPHFVVVRAGWWRHSHEGGTVSGRPV